MLGILGGMGPAATADFFFKLIALTPACCDQEHIPLVISCVPQTPDRSAAILGRGESPLPTLLSSLQRLVNADAQAIVITCNTSHHWYKELQASTEVPILHIADAALGALPPPGQGPVVVMGTRGMLASGFYQRKLTAIGRRWVLPAEGKEQDAVDAVISGIKRAKPEQAREALANLWSTFSLAGVDAAIMACTEIPLAAALLPPPEFTTIDTSLELARTAVTYAQAQGWIPPAATLSSALPTENA